MDERYGLSIRLQMEALITEREMMVADNLQRVHREESMAYGHEEFEELIFRINNLRGELLRDG